MFGHLCSSLKRVPRETASAQEGSFGMSIGISRSITISEILHCFGDEATCKAKCDVSHIF